MRLGVNIDHVATVREARKTFEPDPVSAARDSEAAGCDGIVCHLRKDRRHINDADLERLRTSVTTRLNLEMSVDPEIVEIACRVKPQQATLVPENRLEVTTEGGLDVAGNLEKVRSVVGRLSEAGIDVSLFIDPEPAQVDASAAAGAAIVEFHTGRYAGEANAGRDSSTELRTLTEMAEYAAGKGLMVCAGHGLNYGNVAAVAAIKSIEELNIGHSIVSRAIFSGIGEAVREMKELIS
jgi:pyridoxine 5-phosphate synthase